MKELIPSFLLALVVLCIPVWIVTEVLDGVLEALEAKATKVGKVALLIAPHLVGIFACVMFPGALTEVMGWLWKAPQTEPSWSLLIGAGVGVGFAAVQLHAWGLSKLVGGYIKVLVTKILPPNNIGGTP